MEHLISGISGGTVSTLILHPLDLIKLRFAGKFIQNNKYIYISPKLLISYIPITDDTWVVPKLDNVCL